MDRPFCGNDIVKITEKIYFASNFNILGILDALKNSVFDFYFLRFFSYEAMIDKIFVSNKKGKPLQY